MKVTEQALISQLFEISHDAIVVLNKNLFIQKINEEFRQLIGRSEVGLAGAPLSSLIHPDDLDLFITAIDQCRRSSCASVPLRMINSTNLTLNLHCRVTYSAEFDLFLLSAANKTELQTKSDFLRQIETSSNIGAWEIDLTSNTVIWSDETYRIHDMEPGSFRPTVEKAISFYHPDCLPLLTAAVEQLLKYGREYDLKLKIISSKNRIKWVRAISKAELRNGKPVRCYGSFQDISEEFRNEQREKHRNERFQAITNNIPVMLALYNALGEVEWTNSTWTLELGWSSQSKEDLAKIQNLFTFIKSCGHQPQDLKMYSANRTPLDTVWSRIELTDGMTLAIGRNVSQEKRLSEKLQTQNSHLELAMPVGGVGTIELRLIEGEARFSASWHSMLGLSPKTTLQHLATWELMTVPEDWKSVWSDLDGCLKGNAEFFQGVYRMQKQSGEIIQVYHRGQVVEKTEQGIPIKMLILTLDISKEREIQEELHRSQQEAKKLFDVSMDPLCIADLNGKLKRVNPAFLRALNLSVAELLSKSLFDFVHPDDAEKTKAQARKLATGIPVAQFENRCLHKSGKYRVFSWNVAPDLESRRLYCSIRDITEMKEAELALVQSSKMASLGEMAGGIAHEINNPLTIIQGKARQLQRKLSSGLLEDSILNSELEKICTTTDRIAKIVRGLRTISRDSEKDPLSSHGAISLVEECLDLCREKFKFQAIDLRIKGDPSVFVLCRPTQVSQIILNLLHNALDATQSLDEKWTEIDIVQNGPWTDISITDSGKGIPPEIAEKIMEPFFTTKEPGKGTGLGLSLSRAIALNLGGELILEKESANTRFVLRLQTAKSNAGSTAA